MRPAAVLAVVFATTAIATLLLGLLGVLENAPGVWPDAWGILVVVHALLASLLGYYVTRTK